MRIIVKNLPNKITQENIKSHFSILKYKNNNNESLALTDISLPKDSKRNFCFIGYKTEDDAKKAIKFFNNSYFKNKKLILELFKNDDYKEKREQLDKLLNKNNENDRYDDEKPSSFINSIDIELLFLPECTTSDDIKQTFSEYITSFSFTKEKTILHFKDINSSISAQKKIKIFLGCRLKYIEHKTENELSLKYYNSLFFDFTTIIERICEEEKVKKEDLIDLKDKDLGARIAILESHLVEQTKKWLEENNINVNGNGTAKELNKKILLIRNFDLLNNLDGLEKAKIKVSPSRCIAIAEFNNEKDADKAYKQFCLKRVNNKAIYCEYLPFEVYKPNEKNNTKKNDANEIKDGKIKVEKQTKKLIIKNVPFQAEKDEIRKILESQFKVIDIRIPLKRDKTHRGFCFVELESEGSVKKACDYFGKSTHLYGRRLIFQPAQE